jgi:non-canonical purine NTP pyrophosphatase (RdgB/HAM1 family)
MVLYYVTSNHAKILTMERVLNCDAVRVVQIKPTRPELRTESLESISDRKVRPAFSKWTKPTIAMDAGFYIHSLNGFPGSYVNFVLGTIGLDGILKLVSGNSRHCEFKESLAYLDGELAKPRIFNGCFRGDISENKRGVVQPHHWSELAQVFIPEGQKKTLAEMDRVEYLNWYEDVQDRCSAEYSFVSWFINERLF